MTQWILTAVSGWSPWLATMLIAALPVTESRASIPLALTVFHLSPFAAWGWSMLGNLIPLPIIFLLLPPILSAAERHAPRLHRFMEKRLRSLADKHQAAYDRY
ncbi:hypothetical protein EBS80_03740, partial [bacterium]|nr:hypothetical protein [bacterium]